MLPSLAFTLPALLLGLLLGSFLNVLIYRIPRRESIVTPRSHCSQCSTVIPWYDNIPLLSWFLLRARCRSCKCPISWRYPAVELAAALWLSLAGQRLWSIWSPAASASAPASLLPQTLAVVALATLGLLLIPLIVIDWEHQLLPDTLTFPGILLSFLITSAQAVFVTPDQDIHLHRRNPLTSPGAVIDRGNLLLTGPEAVLGHWLLSILAAAALLLLIRAVYKLLRHREGMGLGDVKLLALIAAFLGFWPAILALFVGVLLATLYAISLLIRRRADTLTRLPFGSFLGAGGLVSALAGPQIIAWYRALL
ncbi:MAG: A24 family peptidase [Acidobacteriaceae bacterium]